MSEEIPPELSGIEHALRGLQPAAVTLDRDRLMFRAGQESMRRSPWIWPAATAAALLVAVALGSVLALRPPAERVVYLDQPAPGQTGQGVTAVDPPAPPDRTAYLRLRQQVLEQGVDSLPALPEVPLPPKSEPTL